MTDAAGTIAWAPDGSDAAVAAHIASRIAGGARHIAVPGGRTPIGIFARLAPLLAELGSDLAGLRLALTDDRQVPADHPASNFGVLAAAFAGQGVQLAPLAEGPWTGGRFDLVWLGMGEDGHIASIFPGSDVAADLPPCVVATTPDPLPANAPWPRLTLSLAALTDADEIMLVVRGAPKRALLEDAIAGRSRLPIADLLAAARCPVTLFWTEHA